MDNRTFEDASIQLGPLHHEPTVERRDPAALPRCKWLGTYLAKDGIAIIQWHRAGETFTRSLKVTELADWQEEIAGFEPLQAMRFGMDLQRSIDRHTQ